MDEIAMYLREAYMYIAEMKETTLSDIFFENMIGAEDDPQEKASSGALNSLKKAFQKLIDFVKNMIEKISNNIRNLFASKSEKEDYQKAKKNIQENPEIANMTVETTDFSKYEKIYDDGIKELDDEMKKDEPDIARVQEVMDKVSDQIQDLDGARNEVAKKAAMTVTMKMLVKIADRDVECAKAINHALNSQLLNINKAEKILGKSETAKYKKQIKRYADNCLFHRAKAKLLGYKHATLEKISKKQIKTILSFTNLDENLNIKNGKKFAVTPVSAVKGAIKHPKLTYDVLKGGTGIRAYKAAKQGSGIQESAEYESDTYKPKVYGT